MNLFNSTRTPKKAIAKKLFEGRRKFPEPETESGIPYKIWRIFRDIFNAQDKVGPLLPAITHVVIGSIFDRIAFVFPPKSIHVTSIGNLRTGSMNVAIEMDYYLHTFDMYVHENIPHLLAPNHITSLGGNYTIFVMSYADRKNITQYDNCYLQEHNVHIVTSGSQPAAVAKLIIKV